MHPPLLRVGKTADIDCSDCCSLALAQSLLSITISRRDPYWITPSYRARRSEERLGSWVSARFSCGPRKTLDELGYLLRVFSLSPQRNELFGLHIEPWGWQA